ncbi:MAG: PrsW family intramembrane metalloprotease [Clostridia bacterium]|nr:PrsW family intramembrane metalloprotease [Clostridia bacterium]
MTTAILITAALLPALVLCIYIFKKDRVEKEPIGLLIKLLVFGAISCIPIAIVSSAVCDIIDQNFIPYGSLGADGSITLPDTLYYLYHLITNFVGVGLIEESGKFLFLYLITKNNKEFNSLFDGLIYAIFVSLGFAALENILYVLQNGFYVAIMRAVLSVPGHMFFAVMMGYYYSLWHIHKKAGMMEETLKRNGIVPVSTPSFTYGKYIFSCVLIPTLAHGFYDFSCSIDDSWSLLILLAFVVFMYVYCFGKIKKMSKKDAPTHNYAKVILLKKYPTAQEYILNNF